jgi:enoyl-CoA hydratase
MTTLPPPSSSEDSIVVRRISGVAVVSVNNPSQRNALTPDSADVLVRRLEEIDNDLSLGALIIQGEGGTFCSGANLSTLGSAMDDPASDESYAALLAADLRIVADDARIISGFAKIGLHPGGGHFQLLVQASNRETAAAMGIFSEELSGVKAAQRGVAWESVADELVEERALALAIRAASDPDLARKSIQSLRITTPPVVPWATALQAERAPQLWSLRRSADHKGDR